MNATAKYNNAKNSIDLSYQVEDIKGFPGMFEKWFNTNNRKYESIPLPDYIKDLRGGNISVSFSKPKSNQLQVNLNTPISNTKLNKIIK